MAPLGSSVISIFLGLGYLILLFLGLHVDTYQVRLLLKLLGVRFPAVLVGKIEIKLSQNFLYLLSIILEVSLGVHSLRYYSNLVVEASCLDIAFDSSKVYVILVDHNHHLPFVLVSGNSSEFGATEGVGIDFLVDLLGDRINQNFLRFIVIGLQHEFNLFETQFNQ